jgi:hypothetical protein
MDNGQESVKRHSADKGLKNYFAKFIIKETMKV